MLRPARLRVYSFMIRMTVFPWQRIRWAYRWECVCINFPVCSLQRDVCLHKMCAFASMLIITLCPNLCIHSQPHLFIYLFIGVYFYSLFVLWYREKILAAFNVEGLETRENKQESAQISLIVTLTSFLSL